LTKTQLPYVFQDTSFKTLTPTPTPTEPKNTNQNPKKPSHSSLASIKIQTIQTNSLQLPSF
jgi:hypothetical protein